MQAIGTYRHIFASGGYGSLMYGNTLIYGTRWEYLPLVNKTMHQVCIICYGEPTWINVDKEDVTIKEDN